MLNPNADRLNKPKYIMNKIKTSTDKKNLLSICAKNGPITTIYDCGARDALDGIELVQQLGSKQLHVFECNPESYLVCQRNLEAHLPRGVDYRLSKTAVTNSSGVVDFYPIDTGKTVTAHADGNPGASSLFLADSSYRKEIYVQNKIQVAATTLDDYCKTNTPPDLLWMDVQGAELLVLQGAQEVLKKTKVIHLEIGFRKMYKGQALFSEIDELLSGRFRLVHLDVGRWPEWPKLYSVLGWGPWLGNAIYVNKSQC